MSTIPRSRRVCRDSSTTTAETMRRPAVPPSIDSRDLLRQARNWLALHPRPEPNPADPFDEPEMYEYRTATIDGWIMDPWTELETACAMLRRSADEPTSDELQLSASMHAWIVRRIVRCP